MVDLDKGPVKKEISNAVFIIPALLVVSLLIFFIYKIKCRLSEPRSSKLKKSKPTPAKAK
ncbi:uncharacterized protein Smp_202980 [Schistosoma mansoni]|uniref:Smp_202980 n=1 Tax=Schistosoma mansoni TaxID=6183 RepID=G4VLY5_SCHMA|nr:uncharacterized protein Smp_202980 [Schistosoma mansoni]|eukprot:XP_018653089.1 uncharacterized protein Smp_202980 [Schistosoma mansoni]